MLNFAEQTGSGAVIVVWSFLSYRSPLCYITTHNKIHSNHQNSLKNSTHQNLLKTHTLPASTVPINLTSSECKISKKNHTTNCKHYAHFLSSLSAQSSPKRPVIHSYNPSISQMSQKAIQKQQDKHLS